MTFALIRPHLQYGKVAGYQKSELLILQLLVQPCVTCFGL